MPNYEYINRKTGIKITINRPMAERHHPVHIKGGIFYLAKVPSSIRVVGVAQAQGGGKDVLKGYYSQECKLGSKFKSEFKAKEIKKAWSTPYAK